MKSAALCVLAAVLLSSPAAFAQTDNVAAGQNLFRQRCGTCHQIDTTRNGVGPHLQGLIGRTAGSLAGANVSPGLKASGITWTRDTLDAYLADPVGLVRGTRMTQRFSNAEERRVIINFLSSR